MKLSLDERALLERCFIQRLCTMFLGNLLPLDEVTGLMEDVGKAQQKVMAQMRAADPERTARLWKELRRWMSRDYSLQVIAIDQDTDPCPAPEFKVIFVDEMDRDPEMKQMRAMIQLAKGQMSLGKN